MTENIKDKLRKIKALADRGVAGEAVAAKAQLEKLLTKYDVKFEDLFDDKLIRRKFNVKISERQLFVQTLASIIGNRYRELGFYGRKKTELYIALTDVEFIDIEQKWIFHKRQFNKEVKKAIDNLKTAYYHKHRLFNIDSTSDADKSSAMTMEEYIEIMSLMKILENVSFRKQLID
jgi:hypothetical protein